MADNEVRLAINAVNNSRSALDQAASQLDTVGDKLDDLTKIQDKANTSARQLANAHGMTAKEVSAAGKAAGLTVGEMRNLLKTEALTTAEAKKLAQAHQETAAQTRGLKDAANDAADGIGQLATGFQAAASLKAFDVLKDVAADLIQTGIAAEQAGLALDEFSNGQGNVYLDQIAAATRNTVSEMDAARIAATLLGMGITTTAEQTAEMIRVSTILGGTFKGMGAAEAANEFALLMSNMSFLRLDQFGISSGAVRARMAELKSEMPGLSNEMAFYQATMEIASNTSDRLTGATSDTALAVQQTTAALQDLKTAGGEIAAELAAKPLEGFRNLVGGIRDVINAQDDFKQRALESSSTLEEYIQNMAGLSATHQMVADDVREFGLASSEAYSFGNNIRIMREDFEAYQASIQATTEAQVEGAAVADGYAEKLRDVEHVITSAGFATGQLGDEIETQAEKTRLAEQAAREYQRAIQDQHREQQSLIASAQLATATIEELGAQQYLTSAESGEAFLQFLKNTGNELLLTGSALTNYMVGQGMLTEQQAAFVEGQQRITDLLAQYPGYLGAAATAFDQLATGQNEAANSTLAIAEASGQAQSKIAEGYSGWEVAAVTAGQSAADSAQTVEDGATRINEAVQAIADNAPVAMEAIAANTPLALTAINPLALKFRQIGDFLAGAGALTASAFTAMSEAMVANWEVLGTTAGMINGMAASLRYMQANSNLNLNIQVNGGAGAPAISGAASASGGTGNVSQAGGGQFLATGPVNLKVGDNPDRMEMVSVTPIGRKGTSTYSGPNIVRMGGGGNLLAGMGGGNTSITIGGISLPNVIRAADFLPELERELKARGLKFAEVA
jgi:hypothetical protein